MTGTISLKATPINQNGNFRTFRQARCFLGFFAGEYPRHFYSTLPEPECDTRYLQGERSEFCVLWMNFSMLGHLLIRRVHLADQLVVQLECARRLRYASTSSGKEVSQRSSKGPSACVAENIWAPKKSKRQTTNQQMTNTRKDRWITQRTLRTKFLSQSSKWLP